MLKAVMKVAAFCLALQMSPALATGSSTQEPVNNASILLGQEVSLYSKVLDEERKLLIRLPENYRADNANGYPVLVTLDGQTHFKHISGTVDWLSNQASRIPEMIVVAITNTQRGRDMTAGHNNGGADNFIKFIKTELVPYIDSTYHTASFRILAGHSMAGHLTLNVLNQAPDLFNAYITMSPWFHQDRGETKLIDMLAHKLKRPEYANKFVFASIGDEKRLKPKYDRFIDTLAAKTHKKMLWQHKVSDKDNHMSIPSNTINDALTFIFEAQRLSPESEVAQLGVNAIMEYYHTISTEKYGYTISPENAINLLGYHWLWQDKVDRALEIFKANVKAFPDSPNTHDSLAEAYQNKKDFKLALASIKSAIKLAEENNSPDKAWYQRRKQRIENAMKEID